VTSAKVAGGRTPIVLHSTSNPFDGVPQSLIYTTEIKNIVHLLFRCSSTCGTCEFLLIN